MKTRKLFCFSLAVFFCIMCFPLSAQAVCDTSISEAGSININELWNSPDVSISEPMTYDELVKRYAQNENISTQQALDILGNDSKSIQPRSIEYRTFTVTLNVTDEYKPHIEFLCETAESGHFFNLVSIYSVQLVRNYGSVSKQFSGNLEVWLRSGYDIEYVINGDFYNNGTTTISGGGNLGLGINDSATIGFSASITYQSNHYAYFYEHETFHWGY